MGVHGIARPYFENQKQTENFCLSERKIVASCFHNKGKMISVQSQLHGRINNMVGILAAEGKSLILAIQNPVANIKNPPQALKSAIISGVVSGRMNFANKNRLEKMTNWGRAIVETTKPRLAAKIVAENRSRIDLEINRLESPVIPASSRPRPHQRKQVANFSL